VVKGKRLLVGRFEYTATILYIVYIIGIVCYTERKKDNLEKNVPGHNYNPRKNLISMFRCVRQTF